MRELHITAGLLSLIAGAIALYAAKGSALHRKGGSVFVAAMLAMTSSAAVSAIFLRPNRVNAVVALLTMYLVVTGLLAVKRPVAQCRAVLVGLMLLALAVGARAFILALNSRASPRGLVDGIPAQMLFVFGTVAVLGAALDARILWIGHIEGNQRLVRHLWRMGLALWIATASFFLGQAKFFPEPVRKMYLLMIPLLWVTIVLCYWLIRTLVKKNRAVQPPP